MGTMAMTDPTPCPTCGLTLDATVRGFGGEFCPYCGDYIKPINRVPEPSVTPKGQGAHVQKRRATDMGAGVGISPDRNQMRGRK